MFANAAEGPAGLCSGLGVEYEDDLSEKRPPEEALDREGGCWLSEPILLVLRGVNLEEDG